MARIHDGYDFRVGRVSGRKRVGHELVVPNQTYETITVVVCFGKLEDHDLMSFVSA